MSAIEPAVRQRLVELARMIAAEREWIWLDPVEVVEGFQSGERVWVVQTHFMMRGQNIKIVFRQSDSTVLRAGYLQR